MVLFFLFWIRFGLVLFNWFKSKWFLVQLKLAHFGIWIGDWCNIQCECRVPSFDWIFATMSFRMDGSLFNSQVGHTRIICTCCWPCMHKKIELLLRAMVAIMVISSWKNNYYRPNDLTPFSCWLIDKKVVFRFVQLDSLMFRPFVIPS